jgi:hypothetical protein
LALAIRHPAAGTQQPPAELVVTFKAGTGRLAAGAIVAEHPGRWEVAFQEANAAATRFWRRVATEQAGRDWTEERRAVPGRPDLPPDAWISFTVGRAAHPSPRSSQPTQG